MAHARIFWYCLYIQLGHYSGGLVSMFLSLCVFCVRVCVKDIFLLKIFMAASEIKSAITCWLHRTSMDPFIVDTINYLRSENRTYTLKAKRRGRKILDETGLLHSENGHWLVPLLYFFFCSQYKAATALNPSVMNCICVSICVHGFVLQLKMLWKKNKIKNN